MAELPSGIKLKRLQQCNPKLDLGRVKILHALYRGGHHLLSNDEVMEKVFPKYTYEKPEAYKDRKARAFYENIFAMVINHVSAGLAQDPVRLAHNEDQADGNEPDEYWEDIMEDAGAPQEIGGDRRSFDQIMRDWCIEALTTGRGWLQADLPNVQPLEDGDDGPISLADQEAAGDLRSYLNTWSSAHVTDWEELNGRLLWVRTYEIVVLAPTPDVDRAEQYTHRWTVWDDEGWARYEYKIDKDHQTLPNPEEVIPRTDVGDHSFRLVPWLMLELCGHGGKSNLHLGDMLESVVRAHFNRVNGENFQWTQYNFQQLYEFLGPEVSGVDTMVSEAQSDPNRANRTARAPGAVHVRGENDSAMFVGPDMGGAEAGQSAIQDLRDAALRVTQQMALSQDTSGAMLGRSADSKQQDAVAQEIVLGAIGKRLLQGARQAVKLLACGRGDDPDTAPNVEGYERFDVTDVDDIISQSVLVGQIEIPSATYKVEQLYRLAITHLGDGANDDIRQKIREELEGAITQDQLTAPPPGFEDPDDPNADDDEEDDDEDQGDDPPQPPPPAPPKPGETIKKPSPFGGKK